MSNLNQETILLNLIAESLEKRNAIERVVELSNGMSPFANSFDAQIMKEYHDLTRKIDDYKAEYMFNVELSKGDVPEVDPFEKGEEVKLPISVTQNMTRREAELRESIIQIKQQMDALSDAGGFASAMWNSLDADLKGTERALFVEFGGVEA